MYTNFAKLSEHADLYYLYYLFITTIYYKLSYIVYW